MRASDLTPQQVHALLAPCSEVTVFAFDYGVWQYITITNPVLVNDYQTISGEDADNVTRNFPYDTVQELIF